MKKVITVDGNEACSMTSYLFTEIAGIYPITPSSTMAELIDEWSSEKTNLFGNKVKVVEMQSEAGAAGFIHGTLQAGCLTSTYTASQGLLLMIPNMYKMAGEMLPCVIHVAARSLATHALSIFGDHQDIYATRATGFAMLASSSVQDAYYLSGIAHLSAIKSSIPFLHFFDGFRTSHEINKIEILDDKVWSDLLDRNAVKEFRKKALNPEKPITRGTSQNDDIYFQLAESRNKYYDECASNVEEYMNKLNKVAGTDYKPFNYYGCKTAKNIIIAMGSVCETIKETIDYLGDVGLIEVHLYRPFSKEFLINALPDTVKNIAVLDRTKESGSNGEPLYLDIVNALKERLITIVGGRYGLSSKNTTPADIKAIYDMLNKKPINNFTISINDDVTNLSLKADKSFKLENSKEFLIYGYGSDGMVSASKSIVKIIGDNTSENVQGYFQYDSKKSGGVTISHLRFSPQKIRSTYYVSSPSFIAISKDTYFEQFLDISHIKRNGIVLINTNKTVKELNEYLSDEVKEVLIRKKIKVYILNAYALSNKVGLRNKISTIMESAIIKLADLMEYNEYIKHLKEYVYEEYIKKGQNIVDANNEAIDSVLNYIEEVKIDDDIIILEYEKKPRNIYQMLSKRLGNDLPVSAFKNIENGDFEPGTTKYNKNQISEVVPKWLKDNCIECGMCSFVCPHSVIRLYLLDDEEFNDAPDYVKRRCIQPIEKELQAYYFCIGFSIKNCTGCGLCIKSCPGKGGEIALVKEDIDIELDENVQRVADYLIKNIKQKDVEIKNPIKSSQMKKSKFLYPGACAGCGETSYIKLLTQLFGDNLVIANATGCSSVYGASTPDTPYMVPWSNSLFEDNAEYGYGIRIANDVMRTQIERIMTEEIEKNNSNKRLYELWVHNQDDYKLTKEVFMSLDYSIVPNELLLIKSYITSKVVWTIGGDGWAYDIGFGGIDHVLASNENINILVLDTQIYSNTGGQTSKASHKGVVAAFASVGKQTAKKDLARIAMSYPHVYVATVSLGANPSQLIKVFNEAVAYKGPSIVIAYSPCILHGITGGMINSLDSQKLAVTSGYFPLFRFNPSDNKFSLDSKNTDFDTYESFLETQTRYRMLRLVNQEGATKLIAENKDNAIKRYEYYKSLEK